MRWLEARQERWPSKSIHSLQQCGEGFDLLEVNPGWVVYPFGGLVWGDLHYREPIDFMELVHGADGGALHIDKFHQPFVSLTLATSAA